MFCEKEEKINPLNLSTKEEEDKIHLITGGQPTLIDNVSIYFINTSSTIGVEVEFTFLMKTNGTESLLTSILDSLLGLFDCYYILDISYPTLFIVETWNVSECYIYRANKMFTLMNDTYVHQVKRHSLHVLKYLFN